MDVFWTRALTVVVVLSMMSSIQGNPILQTEADAVDSNDSKINALPLAPVVESIGKSSNAVKNPNPIDNGNQDNSVIKYSNFKDNADTDGSVIKPETAIHQRQIPSSVPFIDSMPLSESEKTKAGVDNDRVNDVSAAFTKKVLLAFFAELKKRPDLVDDIVKRETYRLLMDSGLDGDQFNSLPTESDLTQELLPISDLQLGLNNKDQEKGDDISKLNSDSNAVESRISKKNTQNRAAENPKTPPKDQTGDNSVDESLKLQTALTEGLGGVIMPAQPQKSSALNSDDDDSGEALNPSYYYYVYYDENEDTTAKPKDTSDSNSDDVKPSIVNNVKEDKIDNKRTNTLSNMDATKPQDTVIEKLASAVRSVISRDMENQLAKSEMALSSGHGYGQGSQTADVKVTSQTLGNSKDKTLTSADDEMQLQKLAE